MGKCKQCNVTIRDNTTVCPLCQCVIEQDEHREDVYPDIWNAEKKMKLFSNICLFAVLVISAGLGVWNYFVGEHPWCVIPIASMFYLFVFLRVVILSSKGYRVKILLPVILGILLVIVIDIITGFYGWSVNYVLPGGVLLADLIIVIMMIVNKRRWQSYMIMQIGMIAVSIVPIILWLMPGGITRPLVSLIAFGVSLFLFLGTLIIGDRAARGELKRRFHIR